MSKKTDAMTSPKQQEPTPEGWNFPFDPSPRDWTEDFAHENIQYLNQCETCEAIFAGHKRRVTCKLCSTPDNHTPSETPKRWGLTECENGGWVLLSDYCALKALLIRVTKERDEARRISVELAELLPSNPKLPLVWEIKNKVIELLDCFNS